jgi:tellurite methyltransferase
MNRWKQFNQFTKGKPPRDLYLKAADLLDDYKEICAIDIAAGALNETRDMLQRGFKVTAVDSNPDLIKMAEDIDSDSLQVEVAGMAEFDYGKSKYDFAVAMYALPFIHPTKFDETFAKIVDSLKPGAVFAFNLFGHNDQWYPNPKLTFHSFEEAKTLVNGLEIVSLEDLEGDKKIANGDAKHWHTIYVVSRKKG